MRIAIVCSLPFITANRPGSSRIYYICKELSKYHELYFLSPFSRSQLESTAGSFDEVQSIFSEMITIPVFSSPTFINKFIHSILRTPHYITKWKNPDNTIESIRFVADQFLRINPDAIFVHGIVAAQYTKSNKPTIVDLVDSMSLFYHRENELCSNYWKKFLGKIDCAIVAYYEKEIADMGDTCIFVSEFDKNWAEKSSKIKNAEVIRLGIDTSYFAPVSWSHKSRNLLFTGVMNYMPNYDAAMWFGKEVYPHLKNEMPDIKLSFVGANPSTELLAMSSDDTSIAVTGAVPDIRDYFRSTLCFVCPMRLGSGVKTKLLQALSSGIPVISTIVGVDGLKIQPDIHYLLANNVNDFLVQLSRLITDPNLGHSLIKNGMEFVKAEHSWEIEAAKLVQLMKR